MSLVAIVDRVHQRLEAENADRGTYTQLANELETAAVQETDPGRSSKLRSMAAALRKISQQEEDHLKALTKVYQDLGSMQRQKSTAMAEAGQALQGAVQTGRALGKLAGRGVSFIGEKLSALEEEGARKLPIVSTQLVLKGLSMHYMPTGPGRTRALNGFYLDERLHELRAVDDPHFTFKLNDFEAKWFKQRAR
ncbi:MAG: hypothetical protein ACLP9K_04140 [Nitrososphaerales archaeon]